VTSPAARRSARRRSTRREAGPAQIVGERLAEEAGRDDDAIGAPEPLQHEIAQAAAHRVADQQRAGEHRHRRRHAGDHGEVGAPVVAQAGDA
jgi:hypothetical protein